MQGEALRLSRISFQYDVFLRDYCAIDALCADTTVFTLHVAKISDFRSKIGAVAELLHIAFHAVVFNDYTKNGQNVINSSI